VPSPDRRVRAPRISLKTRDVGDQLAFPPVPSARDGCTAAPAAGGAGGAIAELFRQCVCTDIDAQCVVLCDPMDLNEMLANLIDNACKWAVGAIVIRGLLGRAASGLGLPIVRDLAHLYGGDINFNNSAPGGLRATLTLPCPRTNV
jgi:signal transduction histidine kinase